MVVSLLDSFNTVFQIVTDWLLIILGLLLIVVAARAIDVEMVKYGVIAFGGLLSATGFWFRYRRVKGARRKKS